MSYFYATVFFIGVIYTTVTFVFGNLLHLFNADGNVDVPDDVPSDLPADTSVDIPADLSGDLTADAPTDIPSDAQGDAGFLSGLLPVPFKTTMIMAFLTVFGGVGLIGDQSDLSAISVFFIALITAVIVTYLLYRFIIIPLYKAQNTSSVPIEACIGLRAKVISTILENGYGRISYEVNGNRQTSPARHIENKRVEQGKTVLICNIKNHVFYVEELDLKPLKKE